MNPKIKDYLGWAGLVALIALIVGGMQYVSAYNRSAAPASTFAVYGEGKVVIVPDIAQFSFGVITEGGKDVAALQQQNTDKANAVIDFVKSQGVDAKDIRTDSYNISPRYQYFSCPSSPTAAVPCRPSEISGYTVSQALSVKVRDFDNIGPLLSGVASWGSNNVSGIQFTLDDKDEAENEARAEAMAKARAKATALAKAGKFKLGKIISIQESGSNPPQPYYAKTMELQAVDGRGGASPSIEPGSGDLVKTVTITYEIR